MLNLLPTFKNMIVSKDTQKMSGETKICPKPVRQRVIGVLIVVAVTCLIFGIAKHWS